MYHALSTLKRGIKNSQFAGPLLTVYWYCIGRHRKRLPSSEFWQKRYAEGGTSGLGSYGRLADFKADVINTFVATENLVSVIEFGCGDGNQLGLAKYVQYTGFDVSESAIARCRHLFADDPSKRFCPVNEYDGATADVVLSLDVVYHLVEDDVFERYMQTLFSAASRYVIIYSSDKVHEPEHPVTYIKHRKFTQWILENIPNWQLMRHIHNPYPQESFADFYFYQRLNS